MSVSLILTFLGPDRPGLVEQLAQTIADHGGNWLESRMSRLEGKFAGILRAEAPEDSAEALAQALLKLESAGLKIVVERSTPEAAALPADGPRLDLLGSDRPGIIREISRALAARGVNLDELNTECFDAPMSGEKMFRASAELGLPDGVELEDVRTVLEEVAADLMVDITVD